MHHTTEGATLSDALRWIEQLSARVTALESEMALRRGALSMLSDSDGVAVTHDVYPNAPR